MQPMLIAVLTGISFGIIIYLSINFLKQMELEKKFKEKIDGVNTGVGK